MSKYLDDRDDYTERGTDPGKRVSSTGARRDYFSRPVVATLAVIVALLLLGWGAAEYWGTSNVARIGIDPSTTSSTTENPKAGRIVPDEKLPAEQKTEPMQITPDDGKM